MFSIMSGTLALDAWLQGENVVLACLGEQCLTIGLLPMSLVLGTVGLFGVTIVWDVTGAVLRRWRARQPSQQFRALAGKLEQSFRDLNAPGITDDAAWLILHQLEPALESLAIPYPELESLSESTVDRRKWSPFLAMLAGHALRGDVAAAQGVCAELGL